MSSSQNPNPTEKINTDTNRTETRSSSELVKLAFADVKVMFNKYFIYHYIRFHLMIGLYKNRALLWPVQAHTVLECHVTNDH